jgi:glycosyltransferase involved in cell wall biosynthesis
VWIAGGLLRLTLPLLRGRGSFVSGLQGIVRSAGDLKGLLGIVPNKYPYLHMPSPGEQKSLSVVIAVRDRLPMLRRAVGSALGQESRIDELVVVDDGSGPKTQSWLKSLGRDRPEVRVVSQPALGVAAARDRGLREATGDHVCILDSDDRLAPTAVQRIRQELSRSGAALVYTWYREWSPGGTSKVVELPAFRTNRSMLLATLVRPRVPFKHSGTTFDRLTALELGGYDQSLPNKVDVDLFLRFLLAGKRLRLIPDPLVEFYRHEGALSGARMAGLQSWYHLIDRYGPSSRAARWVVKAMRTAAEGGKLLVERWEKR